MKNAKLTALAALVAIAAVVTTVSSSTGSPGKTPTVAVVNIRQVFQETKLNQDFDNRLEAEAEKARNEMQTLNREIEQLREDMAKFDPRSARYMEIVRQGLEKQALLEARREFFQQHIEVQRHRFTESLYAKVAEVVSKYAEANGIDIVLVRDDVPLSSAGPSDLMLAISTRKVLHASPDFDITSAVLEALDAAGM